MQHKITLSSRSSTFAANVVLSTMRPGHHNTLTVERSSPKALTFTLTSRYQVGSLYDLLNDAALNTRGSGKRTIIGWIRRVDKLWADFPLPNVDPMEALGCYDDPQQPYAPSVSSWSPKPCESCDAQEATRDYDICEFCYVEQYPEDKREKLH